MRITITGASGLIGSKLKAALEQRGDEVTGISIRDGVPADAIAGRDAIVHLAGENVAQRWTDDAKQAIRASREAGTRNLVAGLHDAEPRPTALIASSAVGYYGKHGDERVGEDTPPGDDFLAEVCVIWEREAAAARDLGVRVVHIRTGVVLDSGGGALAKMLPFFKLGIGGPVAGGDQYLPWIHADDVVGLYLAAIDGRDWDGPVNGAAPEPVTNATFSKALGKALHRPAFAPVPGFAVSLLYGEMAEMVTEGQRAVPNRAQALGFSYAHPDLDEALRDALS